MDFMKIFKITAVVCFQKLSLQVDRSKNNKAYKDQTNKIENSRGEIKENLSFRMFCSYFSNQGWLQICSVQYIINNFFMIPCLFYYNNQLFQMPSTYSLPSYGNQGQILSLPTSPLLFNSSNFFFSDPSQQPSIVENQVKKTSSREETKVSFQRCEQDNKTEEKPVKRQQNPYRNIYTNITNLILNFVLCRKKSQELLVSIDPSFDQEKLFKFYKYIKNIKSHFCLYFNLQKVLKLFNGVTIPHYNKEFHRILRIAARIILEEKIPICIITSKKLSPELREQHLNARRTVLNVLKSGAIDKKTY